jgi:2-hydroxy-3-keto-5-methylthiopentenyl-1-phosphate phosphatase
MARNQDTLSPATIRNPGTLVLCDFDGTVSTKDTVNRLIREHLISPEWRFHVKRYLRGEIGSKAVYEAVGPLMHMAPENLERFVLEHAELDPDFPAFLQWARHRGVDVKIVSDGFDATIKTLFRNHGISGLEIFANTLDLGESGKVSIDSPFSNPDCGVCGTCKLQIIRKFRQRYNKIILVGDGESDRHAAIGADAVIALKDLFVYCAKQGIPALRADGFRDVPHLLTRRITTVAFDLDGTLVNSLDSITESFNHMFAKLGYPPMTPQLVARMTSMSLLDFLRSYLKPEETETGVEIFRAYYDRIFLERTTLFPGVTDTLNALNGTIRGIVTNKRGIYARRLAEHLGLAKSMARIIGAEDGFKAKPAADMFDEFMSSVAADKETAVYVGDAPVDIEAAHNAGIDAFVIPGSIFSAEELALRKPRRVLQSISDLLPALQPLISI